MKLEDHPTVQRIQQKALTAVTTGKVPLDPGWLKQMVLDAGADDVGFVEIGRPALDEQREDILKAFPRTKTLISFVVRMNREAIRTPARSVSNLEFHHSGEEVNHIARSVVQTLENQPLQDKEETIYVSRNTDAEEHVAKRFPHKKIMHVGNTLRPNSIDVFLRGMTNVFQPGKSAGLNATFHFTFTGNEARTATVVIQDQKLSVTDGHAGEPDLHVTADSQTWIGFLRKERNIVWALLRRKIRLAGPLKLLVAFGKCFPE